MKPDFTASTQTLALIERLRLASVGEVVTYGALTEAIGEDVRRVRHALYSAAKTMQSEGIIFGTVHNVGVKRLTAEELPAIGDAALLHIRRTSKSARKKMGAVARMNDAPNDVRVKINTAASLLGAIEHFTTGKVAKRAAEIVTVSNGIAPPMKLVEALKS